MSNRANNMRDIISSVRDLQDLGDVINGRNVYNININYYENYNNNVSERTESIDVTNSISNDESLIISDEGGADSENTSDTDGVLDDIDSNDEMDIESPVARNRVPTQIRTDLSCPSGHHLDYINVFTNTIRCSVCESEINSRFYRCIQTVCNFNVCSQCINTGRYYRNRSSTVYNPDNYISSYRYNVPRPTSAYLSSYGLGNTTDIASNTPLTNTTSSTQLPGLNNISNITSLIETSLTDTITNTLTDIINNEDVLNNLGTEEVTITIGEMSSLIPHGLTIKNLVEKTELTVYSNITSPENKCHICNEEYKFDDICRKIQNCGHYYHSECIDNWFINNKNCPICNQNV